MAGEQETAEALLAGLDPDAPVGIAALDRDGTYVEASASIAALIGVTRETLLGRSVDDFLSPEIAARVRATVAGVLERGRPAVGRELTVRPASGAERTWIASYHPITHNGRPLVGLLAVEITERRRAEDAVREAEKLLTEAQRIARMGWWTWAPASGETQASEQLAELLGLDEADGTWLEALLPGDRAALVVAARAALRERRPLAARVRARGADGRRHVLQLRGSRRRHDGERLAGFAQDITELDRAEARARAAAELGRAALAGEELEALARRAAATVADILWIDGAELHEAPPGQLDPQPAGDSPVLVEDGGRRARVLVGRPDQPFGVLEARASRRGAFGDDAVVFLQTVANVLGGAVERRRAQNEIEALSAARGRLVAQTLDAEERTRRALSETIHDGALQDLLAVGHDLYALEDAEPGVRELHERLHRVVGALRQAMAALHPTVLRYGGLGAAIAAIAAPHGFAPEVRVSPGAAGEHDELVLSIARALIGQAEHTTEVSVFRAGGELTITVTDAGGGLARGPAATPVAASRERLAALGGRLDVERTPGGGSRATAALPVH